VSIEGTEEAVAKAQAEVGIVWNYKTYQNGMNP
jgi:hypothetical protein